MEGNAPSQEAPAAAFDTSMTFEELEASIQERTAEAEKEKKVPDLSATKMEGDRVPEHLRNKSAAEVLEYVSGLEKSLRISEEAREQGNQRIPDAPAAPEPPPAPAMPSVEQVREWMEKDPVATTAYLMQLAQQQAEAKFEKRIAPLVGGAATAAESVAKERYKVEFELFGPQIQTILAQVPDRSALSNPAAWDDLISYVRGRPGNIEKYIARVSQAPTVDQARERQAPAPNLTSSRRAAPETAVNGSGLDPIKREIAKNLGMSESDYISWSKR